MGQHKKNLMDKRKLTSANSLLAEDYCKKTHMPSVVGKKHIKEIS